MTASECGKPTESVSTSENASTSTGAQEDGVDRVQEGSWKTEIGTSAIAVNAFSTTDQEPALNQEYCPNSCQTCTTNCANGVLLNVEETQNLLPPPVARLESRLSLSQCALQSPLSEHDFTFSGSPLLPHADTPSLPPTPFSLASPSLQISLIPGEQSTYFCSNPEQLTGESYTNTTLSPPSKDTFDGYDLGEVKECPLPSPAVPLQSGLKTRLRRLSIATSTVFGKQRKESPTGSSAKASLDTQTTTTSTSSGDEVISPSDSAQKVFFRKLSTKLKRPKMAQQTSDSSWCMPENESELDAQSFPYDEQVCCDDNSDDEETVNVYFNHATDVISSLNWE